MNVMNILAVVARRAVKRQDQQSKHIKGCETRSDNPNEPKYSAVTGIIPRTPKHGIFAEETRQRWDSGNGYGPDGKHSIGPRHRVPQAAHFPDVLNSSHPVNNTARGEKK